MLLGWKTPGFRVEGVVLGKHLGHAVHVSREKVLAAYFAHARIVVDLLPALHLIDAVYGHARVRPEQRPVLVLLDLFEAELFAHTPHTVVLGRCHTNADNSYATKREEKQNNSNSNRKIRLALVVSRPSFF